MPVWAIDSQLAELEKQTLPDLNEPTISITTLPNGMKLYYLQDSELPVVKLAAVMKLGNVYDSKAERGHAGFFMSLLRNGGSVTHPSRRIDEELEFLAASISSDSDNELSQLKMVCLQKDFAKVSELFFSLLLKPAFEADRLEILRKSALDGLKQRNENPMGIAGREFAQSIYGQDTPLAWLSTAETINKISVKSLKAYYATHVAANLMTLVAVSPLPVAEFTAAIHPKIANWTQQLPVPTYPLKMEKVWQPGIDLISFEGNQSAIMLGHLAETRFNPDKYAIVVANSILGGTTFGARLGDRIRTELGYAYGITASFGFDTVYGLFRIAVQTKSETTVDTIQEVKKILSDMLSTRPISATEVAAAKDKILNPLVFEYEDAFNVVLMRMRYDYYGYPPNYVSIYQKAINAVTVEQVNDVVTRYFFPDQLRITIVGKPEAIKNLNQLGKVNRLMLDEE
jgi:zinc protease